MWHFMKVGIMGHHEGHHEGWGRSQDSLWAEKGFEDYSLWVES